MQGYIFELQFSITFWLYSIAHWKNGHMTMENYIGLKLFFWSFFGYLYKNKICNNLFNKRGYKLYKSFGKWTIFLKWKTVKMSYFGHFFYLHISLFILFHITSFLRRIFSMIIVWTLLNLTGQVFVTRVDFFSQWCNVTMSNKSNCCCLSTNETNNISTFGMLFNKSMNSNGDETRQ